VPARFVAETLYDEDFVIAMRRDHRFGAKPTLARYCTMQHVVVSLTGDPMGFVDHALAEQGKTRRVALTVPNFHMALAIVAETDLICALPRRFATMHAPRVGVVWAEMPLALPRFQTRAIASRAAMRDAGVAWLFALLREVVAGSVTPPRRRTRRA
jgi:DNA-binding transcriptional LysR family regulator